MTLYRVLAFPLQLMSEISFCRPSPLAINPSSGHIHTYNLSITVAPRWLKVVCCGRIIEGGSGRLIAFLFIFTLKSCERGFLSPLLSNIIDRINVGIFKSATLCLIICKSCLHCPLVAGFGMHQQLHPLNIKAQLHSKNA